MKEELMQKSTIGKDHSILGNWNYFDISGGKVIQILEKAKNLERNNDQTWNLEKVAPN